MLSGDAAVHPDLGLDVGEDALQAVVGVGDMQFQMVVEGPQPPHVASEAQIGAAETGPHVRRGFVASVGTRSSSMSL